MYNATNVFENTVRGNDRKFIVKIKCGKNESTDAIKSLKQYSQLPSDSLTIGGAFPSTLELTLWNPGFSLQNKEFQVELGLEIEDGTTEWCPMGYYTSETFKESSDGMITITAYDRIYSKMSGAYFSKLTYPADAIDILNEISQKTGVEIQTANLTSGVKIQKRKVVSNKEIDENGSIEQVTTYENPFDGYTYREALGYIAMLFCKYAIADRNGSVKFVWFNEVKNYKVTADYYYELTTNETAFSVGKITCNTGEKELEVGSGTNNIQLSNPIMTQERLNYIYEAVKTLTFIPSYFPFYGDMRLDIGDVIKVVKTDGSIYSVPIMSVTQEFDGGLRTSVQSFGGLEQEVETKGPLATRLERQYTELLLVKELVGEKASFDNLYALSGEFGSLKADYGEFEKLVTEDFKTVNADIINLKSNSITTDNLDAKLAEIGALTAETADLKYATILDLNALNGKFEELSAKSITTGNLSASVANLGYLKTDEADIKYAKIETLETEYLQLKNLSAETAKLGYLTAIEADIGYAKIDFSNVGKQVVSSSMIMDSAVTNEKVANLSANKITSGTIDASMIRVINLNADNLTVGTINGKLIGNGSVDLDRLSEEVPTKEYLDGELSSLKAKTTTLETSVGNKVEKSVFNELKQTVEENSSKIVSLTTTVSKKADSSTVTTLTNNVNEIRQTATQNTASISGMKADIEKKADGSTVSSLATKVSSVEQNLDGFKTTVSNTYTTKEDFNALEIGGRNLLKNTNILYKRTNADTQNHSYAIYLADDFDSQSLIGHSLTYSFWLHSPGEKQNANTLNADMNVRFGCHGTIQWSDSTGKNTKRLARYPYEKMLTLTNAKSRVSDTITVTPPSGYDTIDLVRISIQLYAKPASSNEETWEIGYPKLELGNKATDWTPAPEDLASADDLSSLTTRVVSAESNITQLSNRITTEVSERTALGTKVSSLEQTASGLTVRVNNTESTANTALTNANKAQSSVDNLEIGGRNLARKTSSEWSEWWTPVKDKVNAAFNVYRMYPGDKSVGDTFIVSFDIEVKKFTASSAGTFVIQVQGSVDDTWSIGNPFTKYKFKTKALDGDYTEHVSYACTIANEAHANATMFDFGFRCDYSDGTGKIRIKNFKLERGNRATDWTPAPEDLASADDLSSLTTRVVSAESNITQLSNRITTEVSERTALGTKVSSLEQTASGLTVRLNNTESTANTALTNANKAQSSVDSASKTATNYLNFSNGGLVIGNLTASTLGRNVLIDSDSVDIRNGTTVLATFAENLIELGKNSTASVIKLCGGAGKITSEKETYNGSSYNSLVFFADYVTKIKAGQGNAIITASSNGFVKLLAANGSAENYITLFTDHTYFQKKIVVPNAVALYGVRTDGTESDMVHMSGSNNVIVGYGSYANGVGRTHLYGNQLRFYVKTANTSYKPYYEADLEDGVSDTWVVDGYISASALRVYFTIPLGKPIIGKPTVTVSSMNGLIIRENGDYVYGSASNTYVKPSQYIASVVGGNCIYIIAVFTDKTNAVTNHPCSVNASIAIEFS